MIPSKLKYNNNNDNNTKLQDAQEAICTASLV